MLISKRGGGGAARLVRGSDPDFWGEFRELLRRIRRVSRCRAAPNPDVRCLLLKLWNAPSFLRSSQGKQSDWSSWSGSPNARHNTTYPHLNSSRQMHKIHTTNFSHSGIYWQWWRPSCYILFYFILFWSHSRSRQEITGMSGMKFPVRLLCATMWKAFSGTAWRTILKDYRNIQLRMWGWERWPVHDNVIPFLSW